MKQGADAVNGRAVNDLDAVTTVRALPERGSLSERAYDHISCGLVSGVIRSGEKLVLRPLAARLGLSPTPVREALLRLISEQALALDDRGSAMVPIMTTDQFAETCEMRALLEARAAERAALAARRTDLDDLQRSCDRTVALWSRGAHQEMLAANADFHRQVCMIGNSPLIQRALEGIWIRLGPPFASALDRALPVFAPGAHPHELLVGALRTGDVDAARAASLHDMRAGEQLMLRDTERSRRAGRLPDPTAGRRPVVRAITQTPGPRTSDRASVTIRSLNG